MTRAETLEAAKIEERGQRVDERAVKVGERDTLMRSYKSPMI